MTINKSKLIELLVNKTGLEEKQVEEQLSLLILRIQQAGQQGKDFQIQGFGTFSIKDDALHFEPSRGLETEINHKYAGMKPIELIGAFKDMPSTEQQGSSTSGGTAVDADFDADFNADFNADADTNDGAGTSAADEVNIPTKTPIQTDSSQNQQRSLEEILGIGRSAGGTEKPEEPTDSASVPQQDEQNEEETTPFPLDFDDESKTTADDPFDFDDDESISGPAEEAEETEEDDEKDPIGTILIICIMLLTVGVASWSVYELKLLEFSFSDSDTPSSVQQAPAESPVQSTSEQEEELVNKAGNLAAEEDVAEGDEPASGRQEPEATALENDENEGNIPVNTSVYGLKGATTAEGNNGYTIVVHSLKNRNVAQRQQSDLASQGYRVILTEALVNGETFWRVSLGQFETPSDAQDTASTLPKPYKDNNFIKRIQ